jgi:hypothetical protein
MGYVYYVNMSVMRIHEEPGSNIEKVLHPFMMECTDETAARSAYERLVKSMPGDTEDSTPIQFWPADERNGEVYYGDHTKVVEEDEHTYTVYEASITRSIALPWPSMRLWRNKMHNEPISGYVLMMNARHADGLYYAKRVKLYGPNAYERVIRLFIATLRKLTDEPVLLVEYAQHFPALNTLHYDTSGFQAEVCETDSKRQWILAARPMYG